MLPFTFAGKVIPGEKIGRTIGFPTANFNQTPSEKELELGVYAGTCRIYQEDTVKHSDLKCLVYFGPRYVFGQKQNNFETYIYDLNQNLYDLKIEVTLTKFIRAPKKTTNLMELKTQLDHDRAQGLLLLK